MKFLCEHCGQLDEAASVRVYGDRIFLSCGHCGQETSLLSKDDAGPATAPHPTKRCPKCFHPWDGDRYCHRCGLDVERAEREHLDFEPVYPDQDEAVQQAKTLWSSATARLGEEDLHARFLDHCWQHGLMELAMRRYRERLAETPEDPLLRQFASKAALQMENTSLVMLESERYGSDMARRTRIAKGILLAIAAILLACGILFAYLAYQQQKSGIPPAL